MLFRTLLIKGSATPKRHSLLAVRRRSVIHYQNNAAKGKKQDIVRRCCVSQCFSRLSFSLLPDNTALFTTSFIQDASARPVTDQASTGQTISLSSIAIHKTTHKTRYYNPLLIPHSYNPL